MSLLTPSKIKHTDHLDRAKFLFIWRLTLAFCLLIPFLVALSIYFDPSKAYITYSIGFGIALLGLIYLYVKQNHRVIFFIYGFLGTIVIQLDLYLIQDSHHFPNFLWMMMLIILAFHGLHKLWGVTVLIVNAACTSYYFLYYMYDHYEIIVSSQKETIPLIAIEVPIIMTIIAYLVHLNAKANKEIQRDLIEANKTLENSNLEITKKDEEKTVLVKEIHHRVKNNLQIIISLLRLQMSEVKSAEAQESFSEAINRVMVMSSIHQKLYRQEDIAKFSIQTYIQDLAAELKQFFAEEKDISIDVQTEVKDVDLKTIIPLGLIINELLSNSFKYAFKDRDSGKVTIIIQDLGAYLEMRYTDDGLWKEKSEGGTGFGLELIETLTEQLNGLFRRESTGSGTLYSFELQKLNDD